MSIQKLNFLKFFKKRNYLNSFSTKRLELRASVFCKQFETNNKDDIAYDRCCNTGIIEQCIVKNTPDNECKRILAIRYNSTYLRRSCNVFIECTWNFNIDDYPTLAPDQ